MNKLIEKAIDHFSQMVFYTIMGILTIAGIIMISSGIEQIKLANDSSKWSTTQGQINYSDIKIFQDSEGNQTYQPIVKFTYKVDKKTLEADRVLFGDTSSLNFDSAWRIVQKYPKNKTITVFYHPDEPQNSVLEVGLTKKSFIRFTQGLFILTLFSSIGILFWLFH